MLVLTCFCKSWSGSTPAEVPGLELVLQRSLALVYSLGVPRLCCAQTQSGRCSSLLPLRSQTHVWSCRDIWFLPTPSAVPDSCLDPQESWLRPSSSEVIDSCPDPQGSWLRSTPLKVPDSCPDPQQSLALAHSLSGYSPVPVPVEFAVSGLLWPRLLAQSCLHICPLPGSAPTPMEVTFSGTLWHM